MANFVSNNTLQSRSEALADLSDKALPARSPCAVYRTSGSSMFLWRLLQAFSSMCVHKLKSREFKSGDRGDQKSLGQKLMLAFNQSGTVIAMYTGVPSCFKWLFQFLIISSCYKWLFQFLIIIVVDFYKYK